MCHCLFAAEGTRHLIFVRHAQPGDPEHRPQNSVVETSQGLLSILMTAVVLPVRCFRVWFCLPVFFSVPRGSLGSGAPSNRQYVLWRRETSTSQALVKDWDPASWVAGTKVRTLEEVAKIRFLDEKELMISRLLTQISDMKYKAWGFIYFDLLTIAVAFLCCCEYWMC